MKKNSKNPNMHYQTHVFCCVNERPPDHPRSCCAARGSIALRDYMKRRAKTLGISDIRINNSGCLERCELGPAMVIYPEGVWYHYTEKEDIEEIFQTHILKGQRVERLLLKPGQIFLTPPAEHTIDLKVAGFRRDTADILLIEVTACGEKDLPQFTAGAHIDLLIDNKYRRSYSIANDPADRGKYILGILREKNSRGGSAWLHENIEIGMHLVASPPINNFALIQEATQHIFIAGGIGITPILAMGYQLVRDKSKVTLHYCTKNSKSTAFSKEVRAVFGQNAIFHHDEGDISKGIDLDAVLEEYPEGAHLYVCGPESLMDAVASTARAWPAENIHFEYFATKTGNPDWVNEEFEISLSRHKKILTVPREKTILEVVREAGIFADASCQAGSCATCKTRLLHGRPEHRDAVLTEEERVENKTIMICVSRAKSGERLVLDL